MRNSFSTFEAEMKYFIIIFLIWGSFFKSAFSQDVTGEELMKAYNEIGYLYSNLEPDSSVFYLENSLNIQKKIGSSQDFETCLYYELGVAYTYIDIVSSKKNLDISLAKAIDLKNDSLRNLNYMALSAYYSRLPNVDSSSYYVVLAAEYFKERQDTVALTYCYYSIMNNYNIIHNIPKTIEYGEMALALAEKKNIQEIIGHLEIALAFTYIKLPEESERGRTLLVRAEKFAEQTNNSNLKVEVYFTQGANSFKKENYEKGVTYFEKALTVCEEIKDTFNLATCYYHLGIGHYKLTNNDLANEYLEKSTLIGRNSNKDQRKAFLYLSMINANFDEDKHQFYLYKYDSLTTVLSAQKTEELLTKYEALENQNEIQRLKVKENQDALLIQKATTKNITITALLLISVLLFILLFLWYKYKQRNLNHKIEIETHKNQQIESSLNQAKNELAIKIEAVKDGYGVIEELKTQLTNMASTDESIDSIVASLEQNYVSDQQWDGIIIQFGKLRPDFIINLKNRNVNISRNDIKLSILLELDYSLDGMAEVLNISKEGVKKAKQRLKKKLA